MPLGFKAVRSPARSKMNTPDLTGFCFDDDVLAAGSIGASHDEHDLEQEALDQLAERVIAARSVY